MPNPTKEQKDSIEYIFSANHSNEYRRNQLSDAFLRPAYQYTSLEVNDPGWNKVRNFEFDTLFKLM